MRDNPHPLTTWLCQEKDRTQQRLADALGVSQGLISQWVNTGRPIAPRHCIKLSRITGIPLDKLRPKDWHLIWPADADQEETR
ncbi:transcriptional regulator [Chitiniphilus eburneus]|uniref:transcriptional regulator n=1 Tax=Chitiniphilus eburneus TaxID=2571148 RepID=UPI0035CF4AC4